jgi:hypothetical protein
MKNAEGIAFAQVCKTETPLAIGLFSRSAVHRYQAAPLCRHE